MIDYIIGLILLVLVALAIRHIVYHRKKCKCGNCAGCMKANTCKNFNKYDG
ncbi:MAG: FeoB-associated Cys-rich membrane protein [Clostridia bacterium]|nr:FeoB-associated Cys-rich membrane protein [Clostridia bacterium]